MMAEGCTRDWPGKGWKGKTSIVYLLWGVTVAAHVPASITVSAGESPQPIAPLPVCEALPMG